MTVNFSVNILAWSFAPLATLERGDCALGGASLSSEGAILDFIPAAQRRRCSTFSKVTLAVAHAALARSPEIPKPHTVFASSHGESGITKDLLMELARDQQLSPMGFSLSVHNAASGLYSIATGNTAPSTAIAAGEDVFFMGLCEAALALRVGEASSVLYVCSDDLVPRDFLPSDASPNEPYAISMLLTSARPGATNLTVERSITDEPATQNKEPDAVHVARWLRAGSRALTVSSKGSQWTLSLSDGDAREVFVAAFRQ